VARDYVENPSRLLDFLDTFCSQCLDFVRVEQTDYVTLVGRNLDPREDQNFLAVCGIDDGSHIVDEVVVRDKAVALASPTVSDVPTLQEFADGGRGRRPGRRPRSPGRPR